VIAQHPARNDERLLTPRLELVPVITDDAEELTDVFGDQRLYAFLVSQPTTTEQLRDQFARLAADRLADEKGTAQRNWTVRRRSDGRAVGMLQAAFSDQGRAAEIAWAVGVPWQGQGIASEAGPGSGWLARAPQGIHHHRPHPPRPPCLRQGGNPGGPAATGEYRDHEGIREQLWRRELASWGN
jgi:Acetyltransferase (GNAT) domain